MKTFAEICEDVKKNWDYEAWQRARELAEIEQARWIASITHPPHVVAPPLEWTPVGSSGNRVPNFGDDDGEVDDLVEMYDRYETFE